MNFNSERAGYTVSDQFLIESEQAITTILHCNTTMI